MPPKDTNTNKVPKVDVDNPPVIRKTGDANTSTQKDKFEVGKMRVLSGERRVS